MKCFICSEEPCRQLDCCRCPGGDCNACPLTQHPSIWNIPNEEEVWKKMFSKSRPGITLARSPVGIPRRPGRDIICNRCWPMDCGCR